MNTKENLRIVLRVIICMLIPFSLFSQSNQHIWEGNSPVILSINQLYILNGLAEPSNSGPSSTSELLYSLDRLIKYIHTIPKEQEFLYQQVLDTLHQEARIIIEEDASVAISLHYSFETYIHANASDITEESLWNPRWINRLPIVSIPIDVNLFNLFSSSVDVVIMKRLLDYEDESVYSSIISTNHSLRDFFQLDFNWPYKAIAAMGGDRWNFQMGRDKLSLGPGHTGNLLLSDHLPFHEYGQFKTWFGPLKFVAQFIGFPSPKELDEGDDTIKMLATHRLEWGITPNIHIAITEAMMYQDEVLDPRFFNPMMIYHQYFMPDRSNSFLTVELIASLFQGFSLYGQIAMDDVKFLGESETIPDAFGWQLGFNYSWITTSSTYSLWIEHVHTDPYLYLRDEINYIVSFKNGGTYIENYLGYPLGGDAHVYALGITWDSLDIFTGYASLQWSTKGEISFDSAYPPLDPLTTTPTGIPETTLRATIGGTYNILTPSWGLPDSYFSIHGTISYIMIDNFQHVLHQLVHDLQCSFAVSYTL